MSGLLIGATATGLAQNSPLDYTQWRGRDRDGSASAFVAPSSWPQSLTRRWKIAVGEGYATPLVVGDRVYIFTRRGGDEALTAVSASTGAEIWRTGTRRRTRRALPPRRMARGRRPRRSSMKASCSRSASAASSRRSMRRVASCCGGHRSPALPRSPRTPERLRRRWEIRVVVIVHPGDYGPLTAFDTTHRRRQVDRGRWRILRVADHRHPRRNATGRHCHPEKRDRRRGRGWRVAVGVSVDRPQRRHDADSSRRRDCRQRSGPGSGVVPTRAGAKANGRTETLWETKDVTMYMSNPVWSARRFSGCQRRRAVSSLRGRRHRQDPLAGYAPRRDEYRGGQSGRSPFPAQ